MTRFQPPLPKSMSATLTRITPDNTQASEKDTARYLIHPSKIKRPSISVPGGMTFVFPVGTEGFEIRESAALGIHKYLGTNQIDADVIHRAETRITLSGVFPGWTSVANMNALRQVFYAATPQRGKILNVPGVFPNVQYVIFEDISHTHDSEERNQDIMYTCSFLKIGTGKKTIAAVGTSPSASRGRGARKFRSNAKFNTLRKIGGKLKIPWAELYAVPANAKWYDKRQITSHKAPDYRLPPGVTIYY